MTAKHNPQDFENPPLTGCLLFFSLSTPLLALILVPWYLWMHDTSPALWIAFSLFMAWTGLSITAGCHRLFAHKSYEAHLVAKYFFAHRGDLGGTKLCL